MPMGRGEAKEIKEDATHYDAVLAVSTYLDLPAISYAVACSRCRRIMTDHSVKDPGSVFRTPTQCSDCADAQPETPKLGGPLAVADSLVPGSFVLAPLSHRNLLFDCMLWPAMVDYSIGDDSSFCVLNSSGEPGKYYVTFIIDGDGDYGGWFHASELHSFSASCENATQVAQKYIQACEKCRQAGESLPDRMREFSPAARMAREHPYKRTGGSQAQQIPIEKEEEVLEAAAKAHLRTEAKDRYCELCKRACPCSGSKTTGRTLPSAAKRVVFLTQKLRETRLEHVDGEEEAEDSIAVLPSEDEGA